MKVLVIPEDPTNDALVIKPIVEAIARDVNLRAQVDVLRDPHLRGVDQALEQGMVQQIIEDNPMVDLFMLMVDGDCDRMGNAARAQARVDEHPGKLLACLAQQEVEVWLLALYRRDLGASWPAVREECDPKERYFDPWIRGKAWRGPGGGRKRAMRALSGQLEGLLQVCDELNTLRNALQQWADARSGAEER